MTNSLIKIKPLSIIGEDNRGLTAAFSLPRQQSDFLFLTRKQGSLSGNTYHEGKNNGTNPKTFLLLTGKVKLSYRKTGETEKHSETINAPALIEVEPYIIHNIEALSDCLFLECNSIQDIQSDRIKEEV